MSARAVDFQSINVAADPDGLAQLQKLGVRTVPVVARGARYVMGLSLRDVGEFLGLDDQGPGMLPPAEALLGLMGQDKKVRDGRLRFVLARGIGQAFVTSDVPAEAVLQVLRDSNHATSA